MDEVRLRKENIVLRVGSSTRRVVPEIVASNATILGIVTRPSEKPSGQASHDPLDVTFSSHEHVAFHKIRKEALAVCATARTLCTQPHHAPRTHPSTVEASAQREHRRSRNHLVAGHCCRHAIGYRSGWTGTPCHFRRRRLAGPAEFHANHRAAVKLLGTYRTCTT